MTAPTSLAKIKSYPERWVSFLPLPFWFSWTLVWTAILLADIYLSTRGLQVHSHFTEFGVAAFCASVSINLALSSRVMKNLYTDLTLFIDPIEHNLEEWYSKQLKGMYSGTWPIVTAIVFAVVVELTAGRIINTYNQASDSVLYFRTAYRIFGFFILGLSLWSIVNFMRLPSQLLLFKFKLQLSNLAGIGLSALGSAFLKIALMGISSYIILICTIMVSPIRGDNTILIWVAVGALVIFCLFLLPHVGIHRIMAAEKRQQLISFSSHLQEALSKSVKEPTTENLQKVKQMFELQQYLKSLNDWPFNVTALWQLVSALLIPVALVIIQIIFKL